MKLMQAPSQYKMAMIQCKTKKSRQGVTGGIKGYIN